MSAINPEVYRLMLERTDWTDVSQVHYIQSVAADDPTLTNLYAEYVASREEDSDATPVD